MNKITDSLIKKILIGFFTLSLFASLFAMEAKADDFVVVTLTYDTTVNSRQIYSPEVAQINSGLDTDSILWVRDFCNYVSFITQNAASVNPNVVIPVVKKAISDGSKTISIDLKNYVNGASAAGSSAGNSFVNPYVAPAGNLAMISTCTTKYRENQDRALNIHVAANRINGVTLAPGQAFSYSLTILPRTVENGYGPGNVISGDKYVKGIGGGICQVSSTLNNAVLRAGIVPIERHAHSHDVGYLPVGMDATVSGNTLDYKFVNTLAYPVTIAATANGGVLTVSLFSDANALGGITYDAKCIGGATYIIGRIGGQEVSRVRAY